MEGVPILLVAAWGPSADASSHGFGKWAPSPVAWGSVRGGSPSPTGFAGKVGGEASSASPISSGIAAKVGVVDVAESHAGSHGSAAPIADGLAAKVGVSESPGPSTGTLLTEQVPDGEDDAVRSHAFPLLLPSLAKQAQRNSSDLNGRKDQKAGDRQVRELCRFVQAMLGDTS